MALIDRSATVTSDEALQVLRLDYDRLGALITANPRVRQTIGEIYARHRSAA